MRGYLPDNQPLALQNRMTKPLRIRTLKRLDQILDLLAEFIKKGVPTKVSLESDSKDVGDVDNGHPVHQEVESRLVRSSADGLEELKKLLHHGEELLQADDEQPRPVEMEENHVENIQASLR